MNLTLEPGCEFTQFNLSNMICKLIFKLNLLCLNLTYTIHNKDKKKANMSQSKVYSCLANIIHKTRAGGVGAGEWGRAVPGQERKVSMFIVLNSFIRVLNLPRCHLSIF